MENCYAEGVAVGIEKAVGVAILRRRQFYADGQLCGLPETWPTPTAPIFDRQRRCRPSAPFTIPVVTSRLSPYLPVSSSVWFSFLELRKARKHVLHTPVMLCRPSQHAHSLHATAKNRISLCRSYQPPPPRHK
jgi:hypothetical protein